MLTITIPKQELWNENNQEFIYSEERTITLEHSLVSLAKWESKWNKPFLVKSKRDDQKKTAEEQLDYIKCMTITNNVPLDTYKMLTTENLKDIQKYIEEPMTATQYFNNEQNKGKYNTEPITAELIYYWIIAFDIPMECQKWHLNRLLSLIQMCDIKNNPPKKLSNAEILSRNKSINDARKAKLNTRG